MSRRSFWVKQITLWHWVSSGICLGGMLLFTLTGITLNHAALLTTKPVVQQFTAPIPPHIKLPGAPPLTPELVNWLAAEFHVTTPAAPPEWSVSEIYISLPRPGGDGWATIDRATGVVHYERTDRGWIAYLNDIHKGRNTGSVWIYFMDLLAAAFLVFTVTGLFLLQIHAAKRVSTWPLVTAGLFIPAVLMILFVHR